MEKWREVLDFGNIVTKRISINDFILPELISIYYSQIKDTIATFMDCFMLSSWIDLMHLNKLEYITANGLTFHLISKDKHLFQQYWNLDLVKH